MILAVAPTPSIDRAVVIPGFRLGAIHRPRQVLALAGGKGLNVARAVRRLGGEVRVCTMLAGFNGRWIAEQLVQEGIPFQAAWYPGETRLSTSIVDPEHAGELTEIYEASATITLQNWLEFEEALHSSLDGARWAAISGSLPPGAPPDGMLRLLGILESANIPCAVDGRGNYLRSALNARPYLLKINAAEAAEVLGLALETHAQALAAARTLQDLGPATVVITLGACGAVVVERAGAWSARLPALPAVAPVGSGDVFLGAYLFALSHGSATQEALRRGMAAGAANALAIGVAVFDLSTVEKLARQVIIERG